MITTCEASYIVVQSAPRKCHIQSFRGTLENDRLKKSRKDLISGLSINYIKSEYSIVPGVNRAVRIDWHGTMYTFLPTIVPGLIFSPKGSSKGPNVRVKMQAGNLGF